MPYVAPIQPGLPRDRILSMGEVMALLEAVEHNHLLMFVLVALNTLARPEAVRELTVFQIDFEHRLIDLNPRGRRQTKKYRPVVPITETLLPWLRSASSEYVVNWFGRPISGVRIA